MVKKTAARDATVATSTNRSHGSRAVPGRVPRGSRPANDHDAMLSPITRFILDKLDRGVLLLDAKGAVLDANSHGHKAMATCNGISVRNGRLTFPDPDVDARFVRMLAPTRNGAPGKPLAASLKRPGACGCRVVVAHANSHGQRRGVRYVALIYAQGSRGLSGGVLAELYGLTRAQAAVARKLYAGCTVEETAAQLKLSLNTVRTHLKQIFSKCEVQSQAELHHLLATGPQVL